MDHSMHMNHDHHMMMQMNHSMENNSSSMSQNIVAAVAATSGGMHNMDGMDMPELHGMMPMYFHFSETAQILFKSWLTETALAMFFSCLGLFCIALIYEGLKVFREELLHRQFTQSQTSTDSVTTGTSQGGFFSSPGGPTLRKSLLNRLHIFQSFLQIIQVTLSYMLMLVFMTFNVWLCLSVVLGSGVGYFLFCWRRTVYFTSSTEHCH